MSDTRTPILYIAPWVDLGTPERSTIEWFEHVDRERWAPSLIATQPSRNRSLHMVEPFAEEIWDLPDLMSGEEFPEFILGFIESRAVRLVHIMDSRLAFNLLPDMASLPQPPAVVAELHAGAPGRTDYVRYATRRYGNLIDAFAVGSEQLKEAVAAFEIPRSRIDVVAPGDGMGGRLGALYERLLAARPAGSRERGEELFGGVKAGPNAPGTARPAAVRLPRNPLPERTVGVIVPCYRHGIFLDECVDSIRAQTLAPARVVVVDDGSDDPETIEALDRLEGDPGLTVLRLPVNGGPSIARNRGLAQLETSYVLSIDADDRLLPDALERMLAQLERAPENVGFVYPHAQHIGNRSDYVELPAYNLWLLMQENYCPAPALFDRRVFEGTGVEYPEDIVVGHEDWDLILQLAEREVQGLHADGPTFLYRKQGFSRVNAVEYGPHSFHQSIERRHPSLYLNADEIKAGWAPALSIVLLDEDGTWDAVELPDLARQTCRDFELVPAQGSLQEAIGAARGRWICVLSVPAAAVLENVSFVEQLLYGFRSREKRTFAIALGSTPGTARHAFAQLDDDERLAAQPVGIAFERLPSTRFPKLTLAEGRSALADLAVGLQANGFVQWRHAAVDAANPGQEGDATAPAGPSTQLDLNDRQAGDRPRAAMRGLVFHQPPRLPELTPGTVRRWEQLEGWIPSGTQPLCRHVDFNEIGRIVSNDREPPAGYELEFDLGAIQTFAAPGTRRLIYADNSFELCDDQDALDEGCDSLGYVEEEPLPLLVPLELRQMPETDRHVLVAGPEDPLFEIAEPVAALGWIEPFPTPPRDGARHHGPWGVTALRRYADRASWRHLYRAGGSGEEPDGVMLGSLYPDPDEDLVALQLRPDGRLASGETRPGRASRDPRKIGSWVAATADAGGRSRSPAGAQRRLRHLARNFNSRKLVDGEGATLGWLRREDSPGCGALFSTTHPVTGDQLVTRFAQSAMDLGYLVDGVLGYILVAGACDEAGEESKMTPWARNGA
jgi:Glycosyl transferase family 2